MAIELRQDLDSALRILFEHGANRRDVQLTLDHPAQRQRGTLITHHDRAQNLVLPDQNTEMVYAAMVFLLTLTRPAADGEHIWAVFAGDGTDRALIAAATADGSLHLVDTANLSSALSVTPATAKGAAPGALASFVDGAGTRWVLVAQTARKGAIQAYKVSDDGKLASGWTSRELVSPLTPTIINGVVIATSSGEVKSADNKLTAARSGKAVVYLLDGTTGKELWNSGTTVASFARGNALSGGMGQFYLTTYDGTLYAFGFPIEH